jgi:DNA-binding transcriptional LysR family regulator
MNSTASSLLPSFDWTLVRSFLAALEHGSLLGAARALQSSQPTLGRHIAELEAQLGATLFERTGRGLLPTDMALRLADAARQMESGAAAMARAASGAQGELAGRVRISASQPVACVLLPPILAQMRLTLPDVAVELVVSNQVSNLLKREADIALRMVQPEQGSVIARRVGQVSLGTYAHHDYLRRRGTPKQPTDLLNHDLISGDRDDQVERGIRAMGYEIDPARFVLRTDDLIAYAAAIRAGMGIGFIADYLAQTDAQLVPLLPTLKLPALPMWLVVHREIRSSRRIKAVYDFLAQALPKAL